jgi:ABC-2 type transport system permease protein
MENKRNSLRTYMVAASTAIREKAAYPGNFAGGLLTYGLFIFIFSRIWASAYADKPNIAGYNYSMVLWYFIVAELSIFSFGRFFHTLSQDMKSGQVAYLLARPYDFVTYHFAERYGGSFMNALVFTAEALVLGSLFTGGLPPFPAGTEAGFIMHSARFIFTLLSLCLAGALNFFLQTALAMTAFWLEENEAFFWIYQKITLIVGTLLPLEFLPGRLAFIARFTPFPYTTYAPARIAVAFAPKEALTLLGLQACWLAGAVLLARGVFALGSRRVAINGG